MYHHQWRIWLNLPLVLHICVIGPLRTNYSEISIEIHILSFKKMHLKLSSAKWRPFCLGLNVLKMLSVKWRPFCPGRYELNGSHESTMHWWYSHNKAKHNKTVVHGLYCRPYSLFCEHHQCWMCWCWSWWCNCSFLENPQELKPSVIVVHMHIWNNVWWFLMVMGQCCLWIGILLWIMVLLLLQTVWMITAHPTELLGPWTKMVATLFKEYAWLIYSIETLGFCENFCWLWFHWVFIIKLLWVTYC